MRRIAAGLVGAAFVAVFFACGGSTSPVSDGTGSSSGSSGASSSGSSGSSGASGSGSSGSSGATGDGGCVDPVEGASCTKGDVACEPPGIDICCRGYAWSCDGTWKKLGLGCACLPPQDSGSFACGAQTCTATQFCQTTTGGAQLPDAGALSSSQCVDAPAQCGQTATCSCLDKGGACPCDESDGHPRVTCFAP